MLASLSIYTVKYDSRSSSKNLFGSPIVSTEGNNFSNSCNSYLVMCLPNSSKFRTSYEKYTQQLSEKSLKFRTTPTCKQELVIHLYDQATLFNIFAF